MKHIFIVILLFFSFGLVAQSTVTARKVKARDVLEVATYRVVGISNDGTFTASATDSLVTQSAIKEYLSSLPFGGTTNTAYLISSMSDTITITTPVNGDIAFVDSTLVAFRSAAKWNVFAGGGASGSGSWYDLTDVPAGIYADTIATNEWQNASQVSIADSGGDYIATNVEGALAEIADSITQHRIDIDASGDDLGNHTATQNIDAAGYDINGAGTVNTDVLSTDYVLEDNHYVLARGYRNNLPAGDTIYMGYLTKSSYSFSQAIEIIISGSLGLSKWQLWGYNGYQNISNVYANDSDRAFEKVKQIKPVLWMDNDTLHVALANSSASISYISTCRIIDLNGAQKGSWVKSANGTLPAGFSADILNEVSNRATSLSVDEISSDSYVEDNRFAVGLRGYRNNLPAGDTIYIGSLEKIAWSTSQAIELDISSFHGTSKWRVWGYNGYSNIALIHSSDRSAESNANLVPLIWKNGNTYHFAVYNQGSLIAYTVDVRLSDLSTNYLGTWTKASSSTLPVGFSAETLTEKKVKLNDLNVLNGFSADNYIFNTDQTVSGGSFGNKPFGLNATTEELEIVSNISGLYVNVYDISNRLTNTILDNVLYELLDKIEALESPQYVNLFLATSQVASSATPVPVNFSTSGGSQFSYNTTNDEATYTGTEDFKALISWQATVSSSVSNEVQFTIYENQVATANSSMSIDNASGKQSISGSWIQTISANDDFSLNVESVDLAGSADITIHKAHFTITKI